MSTPNTVEAVRLEFDDGTGIDFACPADALFAICYGKPEPIGLRGVTHLCKVTHTDAEPLVINGEPYFNHTDPVHGEIVWDREKLEELVAAAHNDPDPDMPATTFLGGGNPGDLNENTIVALTVNVVDPDGDTTGEEA